MRDFRELVSRVFLSIITNGELKREVFDKYDMMTVAEVSVPEDKVEQYTGEKWTVFPMVF